jgi:hypothetical protein
MLLSLPYTSFNLFILVSATFERSNHNIKVSSFYPTSYFSIASLFILVFPSLI